MDQREQRNAINAGVGGGRVEVRIPRGVYARRRERTARVASNTARGRERMSASAPASGAPAELAAGRSELSTPEPHGCHKGGGGEISQAFLGRTSRCRPPFVGDGGGPGGAGP